MRIGILQQNYIIGDFTGNARKIGSGYKKLVKLGADMVAGSEMSTIAYPARDSLSRDGFVNRQLSAFKKVLEKVGDVPLITGLVEPNVGPGKSYFNNTVLALHGKIRERQTKRLLPTYDVFDESRYFEPGPNRPCIVNHLGWRVGLMTCEDAWGHTKNQTGQLLYHENPVEDMLLAKPDILITTNASPYYWGKGDDRLTMFQNIARKLNCPVVYVNQVGGQDSLIFDGRSFGVRPDGNLFGCAKSFEEDCLIFDTEERKYNYVSDKNNEEELYRALVLGTRDYIHKTGFKKVVIGLSGGIDSALVAHIAVDAVGAENVHCIGMPGPFSSDGSIIDAKELSQNLGVSFEIIPITPAYNMTGLVFKDSSIDWRDGGDFKGDVTQENLQARLRGLTLMAYSNRHGALVLSTGNKSELAVGYCTLYGDMCGGLAVISDVFKTVVFSLCHHLNKTRGNKIPQSILEKPPSAELRPDQKDQDSLPPYDVLDKIIHLYVEEAMSVSKIVSATKFPPATVRSVVSKIDHNEYKRQQAAPGLKVTTKAFGLGRRFPIAAKY